MGNGINHNVEDNSCENPVPWDEREIRLPLPAKAHFSFLPLAAKLFTQRWIFRKDAKSEEVELRIVCNTRGSVSVLQHVACNREKARKGRLLAVFLWHRVNEVIPKELIRICKVIGGQKNGGFLRRPDSSQPTGICKLRSTQSDLTELQTPPSLPQPLALEFYFSCLEQVFRVRRRPECCWVSSPQVHHPVQQYNRFLRRRTKDRHLWRSFECLTRWQNRRAAIDTGSETRTYCSSLIDQEGGTAQVSE